MDKIDFVKISIGLVFIMLGLALCFITIGIVRMWNQSDYIKQLEQNNFEQIEEKEYYITRTQKLENIIKDSGIVVDDCECE